MALSGLCKEVLTAAVGGFECELWLLLQHNSMLHRTGQDRCRIAPKWPPFRSTTSMFITARAHPLGLPHIEASADAAFFL